MLSNNYTYRWNANMHIVRAIDCLMESQRNPASHNVSWTSHPVSGGFRAWGLGRTTKASALYQKLAPGNKASEKSAFETYSGSEKFNVGVFAILLFFLFTYVLPSFLCLFLFLFLASCFLLLCHCFLSTFSPDLSSHKFFLSKKPRAKRSSYYSARCERNVSHCLLLLYQSFFPSFHTYNNVEKFFFSFFLESHTNIWEQPMQFSL
jgi:hypothetical protein